MTAIRALAVVALIATLTGCGTSVEPSQSETITETQDRLVDEMNEQAQDSWAERTEQMTKTMEDGRTVECLVLRYFDSASMECDFANARAVDSYDTEVTP